MSKYIFECIDCKKHYLPGEVEYVCPACSEKQAPMQSLNGLLRCIYDYDQLAKQFDRSDERYFTMPGLEKWASIIPLESIESLPPLITRSTPLRPSTRLGYDVGISDLWVKDDTVMPTGSFKDRASSLVVARARELEYKTVITASTGNAATALAGMAASVEMESVIIVPANTPKNKLAQMIAYGAKIVMVDGNYDQAFELSLAASRAFSWYNRNTAYNPFTIEGKKTAALEIWQQLDYSVPDWVVVPTGDGVICAGIEKGFSDLKALGLIDRLPKLAIVQSDNCQPLVQAVLNNTAHVDPV